METAKTVNNESGTRLDLKASKRYDKDFLLSLRQKKLSMEFPIALTGLEILASAKKTVGIVTGIT